MKYVDTEKNLLLTARKKFMAMAATYSLGVFNDNFFKQAVLLLAVSTGAVHLQGTAAALFALPFILFSAYGGWLSDRFPKKKVVVGAKALEVAAMLVGAAGVILGNWPCILAMVFLMGAQSAFFSPALNGAIPELYPADHVPRANALMKLISTLSILAGTALAGFALDQRWLDTGVEFGRLLVGGAAVLVALIGFAASFGVYSKKACGGRTPFPWLGPVNSLQDLRWLSNDRQLLLAVAADTFFYFLASLAVLTINVLGLEQLGFSKSVTSLMSVSLMAGVCAGSLLAAKIMSMADWSKHLCVSSVMIAGGLLLAGLTGVVGTGFQPYWLAAGLGLTGLAGGLFLIPVTSFLQVRPDAQSKGRVLAAVNFCGFVAIFASCFVFTLLRHSFSPSAILMIMAALAAAAGGSFAVSAAGVSSGSPIIAWILRRILALRYKVEVKGLEELELDENRGVLFLPNHPALIDPVIVMSQLLRNYKPRPLAAAEQVSKPLVRNVMRFVRPITLPDRNKNGRRGRDQVKQALDAVIATVRNGEQVLLYPSGRLYRSSREALAANSAVQTVLKNVEDVQVVLIRTTGLWGSSFSRASAPEPSLIRCLRKYVQALLAGGFFFVPKRKVVVEIVRDRRIHAITDRNVMNRYLENFYNQNMQPNTEVPYFWWQGQTRRVVAEPVIEHIKGDIGNVPAAVKEQVLMKLSEIVGREVAEGEHLGDDLGIDSLTLMEVVAWLEGEFGVSIDDSAGISSVDDCILAAAGQMVASAKDTHMKFPKEWFRDGNSELELGYSETLTDGFLQQFSNDPGRVIFSDRISGPKSNRQIMTALFVLKPVLERCQGDKLGIMLPPSVSASITYMATLFSGKTPVMYNWTSGISNMEHGIGVTKTQTIVTARKLYQRIEEQQGVKLADLPVTWLFLEDVGRDVSILKKLTAVAKSYLNWRSLKRVKPSETAVILFTSGSESKPKAVPLTHGNILANMLDFSKVVSFRSGDRMLGMLPPFHSLGLVGTVILPLCTGLRTVYHTNPTESGALAEIIEESKVTLTIGTPTFIDGILQAGNSEQLKSLNRIFTGAEKCPAHVNARLADKLPGASLCEGYGITECSPLVSINAPNDLKPGTIGKVLPSIEYVIVHPENGEKVEKGEKGLLLVRGRSIFQGYLGAAHGKGFRVFEEKLWYDTGDFVVEDKNGSLTFCGRKKRFVKLGGEMISLPAIENVLLEKYAENQSKGPNLAIEATANESHPEIVVFSTFDIEREQLNIDIRNSGLSPLHNIRRVERVAEIPVLGSGKTDYQKLKRHLAV